MRWIFSPYRQACFNLAAEECLLTAEPFHPCLLLYVNGSSVVLGCNQSVSAEVNVDFCRENGIAIVRRISGGGAVFHDEGNLNFCFIDNRSAKPDDVSFLAPVREALVQMGYQVEIGRRKDLWINAPVHSTDEKSNVASVEKGRAKISGTASHFTHDRSLRHGTLLYDSNVSLLSGALLRHGGQTGSSAPSNPSGQPTDLFLNDIAADNFRGVASIPSQVANLSSSHPTSDFFRLFSERMGRNLQVQRDVFSLEEQTRIERLAREKYQTEDWNYRIP